MSKHATSTISSTVKSGWPQHFNYARKSNVANDRPNAKAPVGQGGRFAALKKTLASRPGVTNSGALAAAIGRKKYGAKKMATWSAAGR